MLSVQNQPACMAALAAAVGVILFRRACAAKAPPGDTAVQPQTTVHFEGNAEEDDGPSKARVVHIHSEDAACLLEKLQGTVEHVVDGSFAKLDVLCVSGLCDYDHSRAHLRREGWESIFCRRPIDGRKDDVESFGQSLRSVAAEGEQGCCIFWNARRWDVLDSKVVCFPDHLDRVATTCLLKRKGVPASPGTLLYTVCVELEEEKPLEVKGAVTITSKFRSANTVVEQGAMGWIEKVGPGRGLAYDSRLSADTLLVNFGKVSLRVSEKHVAPAQQLSHLLCLNDFCTAELRRYMQKDLAIPNTSLFPVVLFGHLAASPSSKTHHFVCNDFLAELGVRMVPVQGVQAEHCRNYIFANSKLFDARDVAPPSKDVICAVLGYPSTP